MISVEISSSVAAALPTLAVFDITNEVSKTVVRSGTQIVFRHGGWQRWPAKKIGERRQAAPTMPPSTLHAPS